MVKFPVCEVGPELNPADPIFVDEALANLDAMAHALAAVLTTGADPERINAIFRHAHSIKGGASAFGLGQVSDLMHQAESLLDQWRQGRLSPNGAGVALLLEAVDLARDGLNGAWRDPSIVQSLAARLCTAAAVQTPRLATRRLRIRVEGPHRPGLDEAVSALFRDIAGLGAVLSASGERHAPRIFEVQTSASDTELLDLLAMVADRSSIAILDSVAMPVDLAPTPSRVGSSGAGAPSVRVSLDELAALDQYIAELSGLAESLAIGRGVSEKESPKQGGDACVERLQVVSGQLRLTLERIQCTPVADLFALAPTLLAGLASTLGKTFHLTVSGESVRLDRGVVQGLADPLVHLVRNACDHGIESAQERRAAGKSADGRITLSAALRDGETVLMVRDDGRGLSRSKLLQAAQARGIDVAADTPDQTLWSLVFSPGLTTAGKVTQVSGRGIGMDVVWHKVAALGGTVEIDSVPGSGTSVLIRLPGCGRATRQA